MKREFLQSLQVGECALPKEVVDAIMAENGRDIQLHRQAAQQWEEKYNQAVEEAKRQQREQSFQSVLEQEVLRQGGRNTKAIAALLELDKLREEAEPVQAVTEAITQLRQEHGYLFEGERPPAYAGGTGSQTENNTVPQTLAGALRARMKG